MSKTRNNSGNSKGGSRSTSTRSKGNSRLNSNRGGQSKGHHDTNPYQDEDYNSNETNSHREGQGGKGGNGNSSNSRGYGTKPAHSSSSGIRSHGNYDDYNDRDYDSSTSRSSKNPSNYNDEPINDPPPYEDYSGSRDYNNDGSNDSGSYSKTPSNPRASTSNRGNNNEADMVFTEEEVYGKNGSGNHNSNQGNEEADMTFTEEEVYGNSEDPPRSNENTGSGASNRRPQNFQICSPFKIDYEDYKETLVQNAPELRRQMISRSNPSHIGTVIDRTPHLRNIHRSYRDAGTREGQRICVNVRIIRDSRRYVSEIHFTAPDMHTFEDEPIESDILQRRNREIASLRRRFNRFANSVIGTVPTYFGRPDSHDVTLASAISMYSNNMIRLSRGSRTMIPAEASRQANTPYVRVAQRDWDSLTNGNQRPALYRQDERVINRYRTWARRVLLEHGNTTDEATINNFVRSFNGYRNY
ncbi:MAG: hypothetical protein EVB11_09100 [Winogradskyella sp.]|nr:MAG: hypothetical protein EVB11_09100 [Winogradskyella sp.]